MLLDGEPAGFVEPDLDLGKLLEDIFGFGSEFEFHGFSVIYGSFADESDSVASAQFLSSRAETEQEELIYQAAIFAEVEFLHAFQARFVDEEIVAIAKNRARVGIFRSRSIRSPRTRIVPALRRTIVYDNGDLCAFDIGGKAVEVSSGVVQVRQNIVECERP